MDDVYFDKRKRKNDDDANRYDLPPVNEVPFEDGENSPYEIPFNDLENQSRFSPYSASATQGGFTPYSDPVQEQSYAPYTGKAKKKTPRSDGYAPYHGKQKKNREPSAAEFDDNGLAEPQQKSAKSKPKKKRILRFIAVSLAAVMLLSFGGVFMLIATSGYTKTKLESNPYVTQSDLKSSPLVRNILLIGVDGTADSTSLRSDSMILISIDSAHFKIKISSFMRDSWLQIPDYKYAKLNAACSHGGPQLVVDTIEYNFGVDIEDYVLVNFTMFTDIIDALGGVDVEVTPEEAAFINRTTRHTVESGSSVHLDGAKALVYCRIRKLDSDYMRTYRQRKVIKALISQAKTADFSRLLNAVRSVLPMVETDMGPIKLTFLFFRGGLSLLLFKIESTRIPTDDLSWDGYEGSQSVVELDVAANAAYLQDFIYSNNVISEEETE